MPSTRDTPVTISPDLRITATPDVALTPGQALAFAERITTAAMMRQAALMPSRRRRRLFSDNLNLATAARVA